MNTRDNIFSAIGAALTAIATVIVLGFLTGLIVEWLWNWLVPGIFGLPRIDFWQAWGLLVLSGMLFGSRTRVETDKKS
jgi:hypothetical protein